MCRVYLFKLIDKFFFCCRHASIWLQTKKEQDRIHRRASDNQLQFIYLPQFVFEEATNIEKLMYNEAVKCGQDLNMVKTYVRGLHEHLHNIDGWHWILNELEFNTDQSNDIEEIEEQARKSTNNNNELKSLEPVASTSKQLPVVKRSKPPEPMPSTSKEAMKSTRPISNTSKSTDSKPAKSTASALAKKSDSALAKKTDSASTKKTDSVSANKAPKSPEIAKATRKRKPSQSNATNPKRSSPDLQKRQVFI